MSEMESKSVWILTSLSFLFALCKSATISTPEEVLVRVPWLVSIQATNFQDGWHLCGGVLIFPFWVLTAAHCLDHERPSALRIVTGDYHMGHDDGFEQYVNVSLLFKHPLYKYWVKPYVNDIALVKLSTPVSLDANTKFATLPSSERPVYSASCIETGWGIPKIGQRGSDTIKIMRNISLMREKDCLNAYSTLQPGSSLCAGNQEDGFCAGDNGGPLHCKEATTGQYEVAGIMSWRHGCNMKHKPGVYTTVSPFMRWIMFTIHTNASNTLNHQLLLIVVLFLFSMLIR